MTKVEAAKWLVVAWVQEWSLGTLAETIAGKGYSPDDLHKQFGFMSGNAWIYSRRGKGIAVRRYTADYLRRANDWLWDAKTDADRMALAPAIAKMKCVQKVVRSREAIETAKARKEAKANTMGMYAYGEHRRKCNRSAWSTCK